MIFDYDLLFQFWMENWRIMLLAAGLVLGPLACIVSVLTARECYRRFKALPESRKCLLGTLARVYAGVAGGIYLLYEVPQMTPLLTARDNVTALPVALAGLAVLCLAWPSAMRAWEIFWRYANRTRQTGEVTVMRLKTRLEEPDPVASSNVYAHKRAA